MMRRFKDRREAGRQLGSAMIAYRNAADGVILGLPRGGVVVAAELAGALDLPMDVFVVRKVGVPGHQELAMGAVASGGVRVLNHAIIQRLRISEDDLEAVTAAERQEIQRREKTYRPGAGALDLTGKTVILTDDGLATGATMRAAVRAVKAQKADRVIMAVPVAAPESLAAIQPEVDEAVCLKAPESFQAVGLWYDRFEQVSDEEVRDIMSRQSR